MEEQKSEEYADLQVSDFQPEDKGLDSGILMDPDAMIPEENQTDAFKELGEYNQRRSNYTPPLRTPKEAKRRKNRIRAQKASRRKNRK